VQATASPLCMQFRMICTRHCARHLLALLLALSFSQLCAAKAGVLLNGLDFEGAQALDFQEDMKLLGVYAGEGTALSAW